jgi:tripartite-type tricarboxylate transporter receptor subunit TctC
MAPKGTPQDVIAKLNQALRRVLDAAEVRERIEKNGFGVWPSTTAAAIAFVDSEVEKFSRIAKASNIVSD